MKQFSELLPVEKIKLSLHRANTRGPVKKSKTLVR